MAAAVPRGRTNQRRRTRKDLLQAAARLMKDGRRPTLDDVAEEALVSRATAYRYFPGLDALLLEASVDLAAPEPEHALRDAPPDDPVARLERVDRALDAMIADHEPALRLMLARALEQRAAGDTTLPVRQDRRTPLIEAALAPARKQFSRPDLKCLTRALALVLGTEATIVFRDVLQLDDREIRGVKDWTIRALVQAARKRDDRSEQQLANDDRAAPGARGHSRRH